MTTENTSHLVIYQTREGLTKIDVRLEGGTVWLTQKQMAELFQVKPQNVTMHLKNIYREGELDEISTCKDFLQVQLEGSRKVRRNRKFYNLDAIISVGYRVSSGAATGFRQWATQHIREYIVKGFVMDDERLKNPDGRPDYFDELLARIRDIRASEKRFYQKVRDIFALSSDYDKSDRATQVFFAETQNKLLFAITKNTAAELIVERASASHPTMALTSWKGSVVRLQDIVVAKNYLSEDEIDSLNRLVVIFLETAELRVKTRNNLTMAFWRENVDKLLVFNDQPLLVDKGQVSRTAMEQKVREIYEIFDQKRKKQALIDADQEDLRSLEQAEKLLIQRK